MLFKKETIKKNEGHYFPLFNLKGLKSSITPNLLGDIKLDYHSYLIEPISERGLFESYGRHIIFTINEIPYYLSGKGIYQQNDTVEVSYGGMYQTVNRTNSLYEIKVTSFIALNDNIELHEIKYKNISREPYDLKVVPAVPLYGRSADNIHDHRHVTSLLNRAKVIKNGILMKPTLSFDERGHNLNHLVYGILSNSLDLTVEGYYPSYEDFINGSTLLTPRGLDNKFNVSDEINGYEILGGIGYQSITIKPNQEITIYMGLAIETAEDKFIELSGYLNRTSFHEKLKEVIMYFDKLFGEFQVLIKDKSTTEFLSFIPIQPVLRRLFGNSYLPHHDYGKGGRGWRDLFQDLLYMIMVGDKRVKNILINNFKGVRIDGSNATIIGDELGEFKADRNNITRIWSDHALWPLFTLNSYLDYFNDDSILMEQVSYFDDQFTHFTYKQKSRYSKDNTLRINDKVYTGTILEHVLIETIIGSLNLGEQGFVKLEDADWNDGLDMAKQKGETIAFTHYYINNLKIIIELLSKYETVTLLKDLGTLILNMNESKALDQYFDSVSDFNDTVSVYNTNELINKIKTHIKLLNNNIKKHAFMMNGALQSYIDNDGNFLDKDTVSLTGQAMALMNETISDDQALKIAQATRQHLFKRNTGGYHLNENYNEIKLNMGRAYGFSYNHKENGAVFSHMVLMYVYGLYRYDLVSYANEGIYALIDRAKSKDSKVTLGIPEYFTDKGQGKYLYLTGSATWLLKVIREEMIGLKMKQGKLFITPKLLRTDFYNGIVKIDTIILNKKITLTIHNKRNLEYGDYQVSWIKDNGIVVENGLSHINGNLEVYLDVKD